MIKKSMSNIYPSSSDMQTKTTAKLRSKPNTFGELIVKIPKNSKIQAIRENDSYWKVSYKNWSGYLNEMYIRQYNN